jgi:hypothetical protein
MTLILNGTDGLSDVDGTAATPAIRGTDANTGIFFPAADTIAFSEGGVESMRIDSAGNVGIGDSSPTTKLFINTSTSATAITCVASNSTSSQLRLGIAAFTSGVPSINGTGNGLDIGSTENSSVKFFTFNAERMRITSAGDVVVGATAASAKFDVTTSGNSFNYISINTNTASTANYLYWGFSNAATRFIVYGNGGIANFSANNVNLSDETLKKDILPAPNYLDKLCQIPVKTYLYKDQVDSDLNLGAIAQDVQAVCPELVGTMDIGSKDKQDIKLAIYETDLKYAMLKAIQELKATVDAQAVRIATLEAKG